MTAELVGDQTSKVGVMFLTMEQSLSDTANGEINLAFSSDPVKAYEVGLATAT